MAFVEDFYDRLSPFYHLIYQDWDSSMARQGVQLAALIRDRWENKAKTVLDVSCGIGTQSLGLAAQGFAVTGSDLSQGAIRRAHLEAKSRGLQVAYSVCDMREIETHHPDGFDIVLSADNSVPHLLSDEEILLALRAMYSRIRPGGGCIVTLRDYEQEERGRGLIKPYGVREVDGLRYLIWQVWDFEGDQYVLSMYFLEDKLQCGEVRTQVMRSRYYAVPVGAVRSLMEQAGFKHLERLDDVFFQPVLVGRKGI